MSSLQKLETKLDGWLNKKAPIKLPPEGRKTLAGALWWISLIVGILQLWGAWALWNIGHATTAAYSAYLSDVYGETNTAIHLGLFYWIAFFCILFVGVITLIAAPKLKQMKKTGWNLLFYSMLLNAAFALFRLFSGVDGIFSGFFGAVLGALIGSFLLFQVRDYFTGKHAAHETASSAHKEAMADLKSREPGHRQ
jgi:TRAP-type C4-dicarboxylate transport system permease small subunit